MLRSECSKCYYESMHIADTYKDRLSDECLHNRYVYVYFKRKRHSSEMIPYYVGKGSIRRVFSAHTNVYRPRSSNKIRILGDRMGDADARQAEILLIYLYGRKCNKTGPLENLSHGGDVVATFHITKDLKGSHYTSVLADDRFYAANPDFHLIDSGNGYKTPNKFPRLFIAGSWRGRKDILDAGPKLSKDLTKHLQEAREKKFAHRKIENERRDRITYLGNLRYDLMYGDDARRTQVFDEIMALPPQESVLVLGRVAA